MNKRQATQLKERFSAQLLSYKEVVGVGIGREERKGSYQLVVFVMPNLRQTVRADLTRILGDYPHQVVESGPFNLQTA